MNVIEARFGRPRVFLPVIHCIDRAQVFRAAEVAMEACADGLWLISHSQMADTDMLGQAGELAQALGTTSFVGVNVLGDNGRGAEAVFHNELGGLWVDDVGLDGPDSNPQELPMLLELMDGPAVNGELRRDAFHGEVVRSARPRGRGTLLFGGVAFKGRASVHFEQLGPAAARAARAGVHVVTTSGYSTGVAPPVEKIRLIREALGNHPLAIASGITPHNIAPFLPLADAFLVATGIESSFGVFDPAKTQALAAAIHA
jgi:hypothetical protein